MLNFWSLLKRLRPKVWPKEGQHFSKSKKSKMLDNDKKNCNKRKTFCQNKQKTILHLWFFMAFEGHLSQKNQKVIFCLFQQKGVILL